MPNNIHIASTEIINQNSLQITFTDDWYQEDISLLNQHILCFLKGHHIIETTLGADRQYCRFEWQDQYFVIHFEYYCQACWVENETISNVGALNSINNNLIIGAK